MSMREQNQLQVEIALYLAAKLGLSKLEAVTLIAVPVAAMYSPAHLHRPR